MIGNMSGTKFEFFADDGQFPNSVLPVVLYRQAISDEAVTPEALERLFDANGWPSQWRAGVYDFHHYHSTAHECMGIAAGSASLRLGGPAGRSLALKAGDVLVLPAGVAHRCEGAEGGFLVVGAYPPGQKWDTMRGEVAERPDADKRIARVPLPTTDPVGGQHGPIVDKWR